MRKNGWTDPIPVEVEYGGLEFTDETSILIGQDGEVVYVGVYDLKPKDIEAIKRAAQKRALEILDTLPES